MRMFIGGLILGVIIGVTMIIMIAVLANLTVIQPRRSGKRG